MLQLDRVSKAFGARLALDAVSFGVRRGEILALLGHNGAGKSTLFASILGLVRLSGGDVLVDGVSVRRAGRRARSRVGSVLAPAFYEYLSGWDNLRILTSYSAPVTEAEMGATVRFVGLAERIDDRVRVYSHGMRRRLALAQALLPRPGLLLVDEWEAGLDPEGVHEMRELILRLNREHGTTVVVSSHSPAGVERMCDRLAILREGRLVFHGGWSDLDGRRAGVRLDLDDWARARPALEAAGAEVGSDGVVMPGPAGDVADLVAALVRAGVRVRAVEPVRGTPDERYLHALAAAGTAAVPRG
ncbi:MAG TPA: ABC transporter ATP-binding protein [Candidatus Binatia bacterium]